PCCPSLDAADPQAPALASALGRGGGSDRPDPPGRPRVRRCRTDHTGDRGRADTGTPTTLARDVGPEPGRLRHRARPVLFVPPALLRATVAASLLRQARVVLSLGETLRRSSAPQTGARQAV